MDETGCTVAHQAWKPYVVYLDGMYWGHMNLRERADRYMIAQFEGLSLDEADNMVILEGNGAYCYATKKERQEFRDMIARIKKSNPAKNPEDLQYILDNVDVDNLFEYMAYEMFFGNSDIGNTRFYRLKKEGSKWRWLLYDLDYGLFRSDFNSPKSFTKEKGMGEKNIDNTIFRALLSVPEYKDKYLMIYGNLFQKLTTDVMMYKLDELVALIEPEMSLHFDKWGELNDKAIIAEAPNNADGALRY